MTRSGLKRVVEFIFEVGSLRRVQRSHLQNLSKTEDSVLDHSFRVAMIGYLLAALEGLDADRVLKMCLLHDVAEARTGDRNWLQKKFVAVAEERASRVQWQGLPVAREVLGLLGEYRAQRTAEAKLAKDADHLEQVFQLKEYADQGNCEAGRWLPYNVKPIKNKTARAIAKLALKSDIHDWWWRRW